MNPLIRKLVTLHVLLFLMCSCAHGQENKVRFEYERIYNSDAHSAYFNVTDWGDFSFEYPKEAIKRRIEGSVWLNFDIDENCQIENLSLSMGLGFGLDSIAIQQVDRLQEGLNQIPPDSCFRLVGITVGVPFNLTAPSSE